MKMTKRLLGNALQYAASTSNMPVYILSGAHPTAEDLREFREQYYNYWSGATSQFISFMRNKYPDIKLLLSLSYSGCAVRAYPENNNAEITFGSRASYNFIEAGTASWFVLGCNYVTFVGEIGGSGSELLLTNRDIVSATDLTLTKATISLEH